MKKTDAGHFVQWTHSASGENCRTEVRAADKGRRVRSALDSSGPANEQRNMRSAIEESSFSAKQSFAIVTHKDNQRVVFHAASLQQLHDQSKSPDPVHQRMPGTSRNHCGPRANPASRLVVSARLG